MSDGEVCRLTLTVIGRRVDGKLTWEEEITTQGVRRRSGQGADLRDYEPEMCVLGLCALQQFAVQCDAEGAAREP